jgi:hypothetical protein
MKVTRTVVALVVLAGCTDPPCALEVEVVPGCGALVAGEPVRLGDTPEEVEQVLGPPASSAELGSLGTRFSYSEHALSGLFTRGEDSVVHALYLHTGFSGRTAGGVQMGVDRAAVRSELGEPVEDLFLDVWWYQDRGIAVEWRSDAVDRLVLFRTE